MDAYLRRLLEFNSWANRGLLDFVAERPETLDLTSSGVYGTIRATFEHLLTSEMGYQRRLRSLPRYELDERPETPQLADLQQLAVESAALLDTLVDDLPADAGSMLLTGSGNRAAATILTQLVMHGVEHRAHVGTILGSNGIEPPDLDAWAHGIWVHGDDWPEDWGPDRR